MNTITFKAQGKQGDYIRASLVPANRSAASHFGLLDAIIVTVLLIGVGGLISFLALN